MSDRNIHTRAVALSSWNKDERTATVVFATENLVERRDGRGPYFEKLVATRMKPTKTVPLIENHDHGSTRSQIGMVSNLRVEGNECVGDIKFSRGNPRALEVQTDLDDGITYGVSVGYRILNSKETVNGGQRIKECGFAPIEVSLVVIPADASAGIRSEGEIMENVTVDRSAVNKEIRSIASIAGLGQDFIDRQIDANASVEDTRAAAFEAMATRNADGARLNTSAVVNRNASPEASRAAMVEGMFSRINPNYQATDRSFVGASPLDIATACLRSAGVNTFGLGEAAIWSRAMTTSDLPIILTDTMRKQLVENYRMAPAPLRQIARSMTLQDFRKEKLIRANKSPVLERVDEMQEFKAGTFLEKAEEISLHTYGKIVGISRQLAVNDTLNALGNIGASLGQSASAFEADLTAGIVNGLQTMGDGVEMFDAKHGNLVGTGTTITVEAIAEMRLMMRKQVGMRGEFIAVAPKYLVCSSDLETVAEKVLASIYSATTDTVNPFSNRLTLIVEPRLAAKVWYLVADPALVPCLTVAHLAGNETPQLISENGFDVDATRWRIRHDFGGAWSDYVGWVKNPGA